MYEYSSAITPRTWGGGGFFFFKLAKSDSGLCHMENNQVKECLKKITEMFDLHNKYVREKRNRSEGTKVG